MRKALAEKNNHRILFGPVASRRLGYSLGVDLVPRKTCTLDCVYCEVGPTTEKTVEIRPYVSAREVVAEMEEFLRTERPTLDCVTLAGSGEPTLNACLGEIVREIKGLTRCAVAVLTNGTLLTQARVREAVCAADILMPSLDCAREETFQRVNRPHTSLHVADIIEGLVEARRSFSNRFWLEILLVKGLNDSPEDFEALKQAVARIRPDRVQLNTVVRPPALAGTEAVDLETLERLKALLGTKVEIIASFHSEGQGRLSPGNEEEILRMIRRRPCGLDEISLALHIPPHTVRSVMQRLLRTHRAVDRVHQGRRFFQAS